MFQFRASLFLSYFCNAAPRGKVSFVSLLVFANDSCWRGLPSPLPASFAGLSGNPGLSAQEEALTRPDLVSSEAQGLGTCLSEQKPTSASAVHVMGPQSFLWSGFPVHWYLCGDHNWVAKKATLRSLHVTCDERMLERCLYPQTILCVFVFLQHMTLLQITTKVLA